MTDPTSELKKCLMKVDVGIDMITILDYGKVEKLIQATQDQVRLEERERINEAWNSISDYTDMAQLSNFYTKFLKTPSIRKDV